MRIGAGATIGANAVVIDDVAPGATVVGAPAPPGLICTLARMWRLRRKGRDGGTAVAEPEGFDGGDAELRAEIERLSAANREAPDRDTERRLLRLRHVAGTRRLAAAGSGRRTPSPTPPRCPRATGCPRSPPPT